jgi:uridine kinase
LQRQARDDSKSTIQFSHPRESVQVELDDGRILEGPVGALLETFAEHVSQPGEPPIVAALVDGDLRELTYPLAKDVDVRFLSNATSDGKRIYQRSLILLMLAAVRELYPETRITVDHAVTMYGLLCQVHGRPPFTPAEVKRIQVRMKEIVDQDEPIVKTQMPLDQAVAMFQERGYEDKVRLLKYRRREYVTIYALLDEKSYFYGYMVPSTGCLRYFDLVPHPLGFVLRAPRRSTPTQLPQERESPHLDLIFLQYGAWLRTLDVADVGQLNEAIESPQARRPFPGGWRYSSWPVGCILPPSKWTTILWTGVARRAMRAVTMTLST